MKKLLILLFCLYWSNYLLNAQTPENDKNWELSSLNDDFLGSTVNTTLWNHRPDWSSCLNGACATPDSRSVDNSILNIIAKEQSCTCYDWDGTPHNKDYTIGDIISKQYFKYGYFEVKCKLPPLTTPTSSKGFSIAFWMFSANHDGVTHSEIDIFEIDCENHFHTANLHYKDNSGNEYHLRNPDLASWNDPHDFFGDFSIYRTFSCEWSPNIFNVYVDGELINSTNYENLDKLLPMQPWIGMMVPADGSPNQFGKTYDSNTAFPYELSVDFAKVYKLKMDCTDEITPAEGNGFNFSTFDYKVKKSFTISNTSLSSSDKVTLRATDFVQLNGDFEVPYGAEFCIFPTECHQQIIQ